MENYNNRNTDFIQITSYHKEIFDFMKKQGFNPIFVICDNTENGRTYGYYLQIKAKFGRTPFSIEFSPNGKNVFLDVDKNSEEFLDFIIEKLNKGTNLIPICTYLLNKNEYDKNRDLIETTILNRVAELTFNEKEIYQRIKDLRSGNSYELFGTDDIFITEFKDLTDFQNKLSRARKRYQENANILK